MSGSYGGWSSAGYSYKHDVTLSTSYTVIACTEDSTNSSGSSSFPTACNIQSVEFEFTARDSGTKVTIYLARDSAGDVPISTDTTSGAAVDIQSGLATSSKGGATVPVGVDYVHDGTVTNSTKGTFYVVAKVTGSSGSTKANVRVNWRS